MDARLHPLELREHVVGEVERPVPGGCRTRSRAGSETGQLLVRRCDLLALAPDVVGVEARARPGRSACGRRSRGTRSRALAPPHPSRGPLAFPSDQSCARGGRRGCRPARLAAEALRGTAPRAARAGRTESRAPRRRSPRPAHPGAAPAPRRTRREPGRPHELGAEPLRLRDDELDGNALDGDADRAPLRALDDGDDLREPLEVIEDRPGLAAEQTTASSSFTSRQRRGSPADLAAQSLGDPSSNSRARLSSRPRRGRARSSRASAASSFASVFGPMPGTSASRPAAAAARNSSTVRTPSACPISTALFGPNPRRRPSPTSSGDTSLSSSSSSAMRPVSTSSFSRASIPGPMPRSSRARPARTRSATGAFVSRIISAARR